MQNELRMAGAKTLNPDEPHIQITGSVRNLDAIISRLDNLLSRIGNDVPEVCEQLIEAAEKPQPDLRRFLLDTSADIENKKDIMINRIDQIEARLFNF